MKNILIIDCARNATFSLFQATEDEYTIVFPNGQDMETIEDLIERLGDEEAGQLLAPIWERPILKRDAMGIHGTLFRGGSVCLNSLRRLAKWISASIMPPPSSVSAR
ncbi:MULTISPECIES: hypothetical protein [unclassified Rhizobium]|uniref:hypothetical protein n=1 Tax=unclassified Rhizobium TaxID=2613769 RepID=UPI00196901F6|nr:MULTISPECIES: hypothetical protein [unclassified Rhizobium]